MNAKLLIPLFAAALLLAPTAGAVGGDLAGLVNAQADATAEADYSGAVRAIHEGEDEAERTVFEALDGAVQTGMSQKSYLNAKTDYSVASGQDAQGGLLAGVSENLEAFGGWAKSLWIKPSADIKHAADMRGITNAAGDATAMDGSFDAGAIGSVESVGHVDYNLPPPPTPEVGFIESIQLAMEGLVQLG